MSSLVFKDHFRTLLILIFITSCGHSVSLFQPLPPDCLGASKFKHRVEAPRAGEIIDTHGQGSDLLGLTFVNSSELLAVDRFDLERITDRNGKMIINTTIKSHSLEGEIEDGTMDHREAEWDQAILVGQLHCPNPKFEGRTADIEVRIRGKSPRRLGATDVQTYQVEIMRDGQPENACRDANDVAIPISGYWDDRGNYINDRKHFSFACTRRDVATCLSEGYVDDTTDSSKLAVFEACTRMMRADYCGDGKSYTRDGTFVTMWDNKGITANDSLTPLVFEAAWNKDGVACIARERWTPEALKMPFEGCLRNGITSLPQCRTEEDAKEQFGSAPLLFNASCADHPCVVSRAEFSENQISGVRAIRKSELQGQPMATE